MTIVGVAFLLACLVWLISLFRELRSKRRNWIRLSLSTPGRRNGVLRMAGAAGLFVLTVLAWPWHPAAPFGSSGAPELFTFGVFLWGLCLVLTALTSPTGPVPIREGSEAPTPPVHQHRTAPVQVQALTWMSRFTFLAGLAAVAAWIAVNRFDASETQTGSKGSSASGSEPSLRKRVKHVVVFIQENHTTDNYFRGLGPYGANVATDWPEQPNPPGTDQPHDRKAYVRWLQNGTATRTQFDTLAVIPYYAYLAVTGAFLENHCSGFGTNSTPNHLLLLGGQSPTLRNPQGARGFEWDMPSVPGLAGEAGLGWRCYTAGHHYPARYYTQLKNSPNLVSTSAFTADVAAGSLPALSYVWHQGPGNEHPTQNVTEGMNSVWQAVDAVVKSGHWDDTVFLLTWDDWGGWDDHVRTPDVEHTPDGVQLAYGPRVPLIMFGGSVRPGIDSRWSSHVGVAKTVMQLLGLPPLGVERVDTDPGLADLIDPTLHQPPPPSYGSRISMPPPPSPRPRPAPTPPAPVTASVPVPPVILRHGTTLPPPTTCWSGQPDPPTQRRQNQRTPAPDPSVAGRLLGGGLPATKARRRRGGVQKKGPGFDSLSSTSARIAVPSRLMRLVTNCVLREGPFKSALLMSCAGSIFQPPCLPAFPSALLHRLGVE
jgi:hypothetical protein